MKPRLRSFTVRITAHAESDFDEIWARIAADSPAAALAVSSRIAAAIFELAVFPLRHPVLPRRRAYGQRIRSTVCVNHRIVYLVDKSNVYVLRIFHAARRTPRQLAPRDSSGPLER